MDCFASLAMTVRKDYASRARSKSSRSSRFVNIDSEPSSRARPFFLGPVAVKFDAVLIGIAQIKRLADAVIAGAVERNAGLHHAMQRVRQRRAGGVEDRGVEQPGGARRRRMAAFAFPGVEADVMMIAAGRNERRGRAHPLHDLKAEHAAVKPERAFEIGDLEMDMPDPCACYDGWVVGHVDVSVCLAEISK